jgi:orotidine-5'-phosphate decarboxylase
MTLAFGTRLASAFAATGRLCVGIDPHSWLLGEWDLTDDAAGVREFGLRVVDAAHGRAGIVKPQVAFYERHGSAGYAALEDVLAAARAAGLRVSADVKRGDVGTSVEAYGEAWLTPSSPLEADAMTVSAFQGVGSLAAPHDLAIAGGKGLFVLAATSNPEGRDLQRATLSSGETVAASIVGGVRDWNTGETGAESETTPGSLGSAGVVIGATIDMSAFGLSPDALVGTPILAPGFGHQGAMLADARRLFAEASDGLIVSASRSILSSGSAGVAAAITAQSREIAEVLA